jgi:aminoglycoside 2'-N-acetyltransferase I
VGGQASSRMVSVRRCHTAELSADELAEVRALCSLAYGGFSDEDWAHALGGMHALAVDGGGLVAHGSLVMRRLLHGERSLRCGYVEAVATHPDRRRQGLGAAVLTSLEGLAPAYDVLALCSSAEGRSLYEARGWGLWRGPTAVLSPAGPVATPDEDSVYVLGGVDLDLDGPLACDWRDGDVW